MRKNQDNRPLKVIHRFNSVGGRDSKVSDSIYAQVLSNLAIAESNLVRSGKGSAMPHFIAIVKELERICAFEFEIMEERLDTTA